MNGFYLGRLAEGDPLQGYLQHDIQPQISGAAGNSHYRVFRLNGSNDVYLYEDRDTGTKVIGKFFLSSRKTNAVKAVSRLTREFDNLCMMRDYGLTGYPTPRRQAAWSPLLDERAAGHRILRGRIAQRRDPGGDSER